MVSFRRKKNVNVMRVGIKIVGTVLGLYAAGLMLNVIGDVMNGTASPFYQGLTLIGWTVETVTGGTTSACGTAGTAPSIQNCVTNTSGTGILAVVGLLAIVWVVFEFVDIQM